MGYLAEEVSKSKDDGNIPVTIQTGYHINQHYWKINYFKILRWHQRMAFLLRSFIRPSLTTLCKAKIVTQRLFNDPIEYYEFACLWAPRVRVRAQAADKFDSPSTMAASLLHSCRTYATYPLIFASAQNNCMLFCTFRGRALCACDVRAW